MQTYSFVVNDRFYEGSLYKEGTSIELTEEQVEKFRASGQLRRLEPMNAEAKALKAAPATKKAVVPAGSEPDLEAMKKPELLEYAATLGVTVEAGAKKEDIIAAIRDVAGRKG